MGASSSDSRIASRRFQFYYVWLMPLLWMLPVWLLWNSEGNNERGIVIAFVEIPILWLVDMVMDKLGPSMQSNAVCWIVSLAIGGGLTFVIGLTQDVIHIPYPKSLKLNLWVWGVTICIASFLLVFAPTLYLFAIVAIPNLVIVFGLGSILNKAYFAIIRACRDKLIG